MEDMLSLPKCVEDMFLHRFWWNSDQIVRSKGVSERGGWVYCGRERGRESGGEGEREKRNANPEEINKVTA